MLLIAFIGPLYSMFHPTLSLLLLLLLFVITSAVIVVRFSLSCCAFCFCVPGVVSVAPFVLVGDAGDCGDGGSGCLLVLLVVFLVIVPLVTAVIVLLFLLVAVAAFGIQRKNKARKLTARYQIQDTRLKLLS